jgi:hypothetical protein
MTKLDELIADRGQRPRTPAQTATADQGVETLRQHLKAIGVDTTNADQMRGVLGGIVLLVQVQSQLGELTPAALGTTIMHAVELQR